MAFAADIKRQLYQAGGAARLSVRADKTAMVMAGQKRRGLTRMGGTGIA